MTTGDAYPEPRPTGLYETDDVDESASGALAVLAQVRDRMIAKFGGYPTGKTICRIIDEYAAEVVADARDYDEAPE